MTTGSAGQFNLRLASGEEFGPATLDVLEDWARQGRVPFDALLVPIDGAPATSVLAQPRLRAIVQTMMPAAAAPPTHPNTPAQSPPDTAASVMIPYKNMPALVGYYMSIGALIPGVGAIAGPTAVVLGIIGLRRRLKKPEIHGIAHAWIAIILGGLCAIANLGCIVMGLISAANDGRL